MRAPIWHDAVTAVRAVSLPAIADDGVIRNSHFWFVNHRERWIGRLQSPDAVRKTFGTSSQSHKLSTRKRVLHCIEQLEWQPDQANAKATQSAAGHITPAMWSTNEHNAVNSGVCAIRQSSHHETIA